MTFGVAQMAGGATRGDGTDRHGAVAVIVPCYNAVSTLAATLESALAQDVPIEMIVIDDGSSDCSLAIARAFEPAVRIVTGPNRGVSAARNTGIAETNAEWIVFLDADDLLEPGTLKQRLATARASNADVVISDWEDFADDGAGQLTPGIHRSIDWLALESNAELATAAHVWATTAAILYRRSIVDKIGGFRPDLPVIQDARFLFDAAYHGARFAHSAHVGARYRILPGSLSRRDPARFSEDLLLNGQHIETLWQARGSLDDARRKAVLGIYTGAGRGLFSAAHPRYFEAIERQRKLGLRLPLHSKVAAPLARLVGLRGARSLLSLVNRGFPALRHLRYR
jgi:glycosyltransferase involved in cell wall biosynthesis